MIFNKMHSIYPGWFVISGDVYGVYALLTWIGEKKMEEIQNEGSVICLESTQSSVIFAAQHFLVLFVFTSWSCLHPGPGPSLHLSVFI